MSSQQSDPAPSHDANMAQALYNPRFLFSNIFVISGSSSELGEIFLLESNILLTNTGLGSGLAPVWFLHIPFQRQTFSAGGLHSPLPVSLGC